MPKQSETEDEKPENPGPSPVLPIIIGKPKNLAKQIRNQNLGPMVDDKPFLKLDGKPENPGPSPVLAN